MSDLPASIGALVDRGVELWTENDELRFLAPPGVFTDEARTAVRSARPELVSVLSGGKRLAPALHIERGRVDDRFAEAPSGVRTLAFALEGPLDPDALSSALTALVARHEVLRTAYVRIGGVFVRLIHPPLPVPLTRGSEPPRPHASRPPLLTAALSDDQVLTLTVHGIAVDGMSLALLLEELGPLYAGKSLPEPPSAQHQVRRERAYLVSPEAVAAQHYWRDRLIGAPALRLSGKAGEGGSTPVVVSPELTSAVRRRAAAERTTPFTVLLTAYSLLLSEITGCEDMLIAVPVAHRWHPEDEQTVSGARDLLLLRLELDSDDPLRTVHRERLNALDHGRLPFEALPPDLAPPRRPGRHPVFGIQFALQTFGDRLVPQLTDVTATPLNPPTGPLEPGFDFGLMLWVDGDRLVGDLACDGAVADASELPALAQRYSELVEELSASSRSAPAPLDDAVLDSRDGRTIAYVVTRDPVAAERLRRQHPSVLVVPVTRIPYDGDRVDLPALRTVPVTDPASLARWEAELSTHAGHPIAVEVAPRNDGSLSALQVTAPIDAVLTDRFGTRVTVSATRL
ncbi:condensation domain-containing protein [Allokutzneria oryzae]|uniref:Condensation domain-containing protein n=1 Tax=Allokutzneria oryzae TaxID=1378989 RepID=A0ABV5ZXK1_9PSEU